MISKGGDKSGKSEEKRISGNSRESIREKQQQQQQQRPFNGL